MKKPTNQTLMTHTCNPATWEAEVRRMWFQASSGREFTRSHLVNRTTHACHPKESGRLRLGGS
jgi:hypothetical protein